MTFHIKLFIKIVQWNFAISDGNSKNETSVSDVVKFSN